MHLILFYLVFVYFLTFPCACDYGAMLGVQSYIQKILLVLSNRKLACTTNFVIDITGIGQAILKKVVINKTPWPRYIIELILTAVLLCMI